MNSGVRRLHHHFFCRSMTQWSSAKAKRVLAANVLPFTLNAARAAAPEAQRSTFDPPSQVATVRTILQCLESEN
jgi:hypothetical protein